MKLSRPAALIWKALYGMSCRNGFEIAGHIAFTVMLSLFPFLIFLVSVAGFFGDTRSGQDFLNTMSLFAPPAVMTTLAPAIAGPSTPCAIANIRGRSVQTGIWLRDASGPQVWKKTSHNIPRMATTNTTPMTKTSRIEGPGSA